MTNRKSNMKAKFLTEQKRSKPTYSDNSEVIQTITGIAYYKGEFIHFARATFRIGRSSKASVVHCSFWAFDQYKGKIEGGVDHHGNAKAGGYGYCKCSAALGQAIDDAGIALSERIHGVGDAAMERAIKAIGKAMGFNKITLVRA